VALDGEEVVATSPISMTLASGEVLGQNPVVRNVRRNEQTSHIVSPLYRQSSFDTSYNELNVRLKGDYGVLLRAYDDGVCYRLYTERDAQLTILNESARLNFADDPISYLTYTHTKRPFDSSFEGTYTRAPLSEFRTDKDVLSFMPALFELSKGRGYLLYTESDVESYPGIYLTYDAEQRGLQAIFPAVPVQTKPTKRYEDQVTERTDYIARTSGRRQFPWRIVAYASQATELPTNNMVYQTASACRIDDVSWIHDGKIAWDWWNNWGVRGVDFPVGINTATYKYFIDFAATHGIEYVALDEGWGVRDGDVMHVIPEIDLPQIISYAQQKHVRIILWVVSKVLDDKLEEACRYYAQLGISGWKVDFINRQDQEAVERLYRIADVSARYHLVVDFHGVYKPTGLQRTYPNVINFEGIFGLEQLKWNDKTDVDMPAHDCTFPFIRQAVGPVDYTQGAMQNASRKNFRAIYDAPMSQGTRAHQVAAYVVFDSPLVMLCDSPTAYMREPETTRYIVDFPTRFDTTRVLMGQIGEYIVVARSAGEKWYLGALTSWTARTLSLNLDFLGQGRWTARIYRDGINAGRTGDDYLIEERTVSSADTLELAMAPGGGYAVQFTPLQE
jgi:alpha-glucosidase